MVRIKLFLWFIILLIITFSCRQPEQEPNKEYVAFKLFSKAIEQFIAKNYEDAQVFISRAIEINNRIARYHELKGDIYFRQELLNEAIDSYNKATSLRSHNPEVFIKMGHIWFEQKKYDQAIRDYKKAFVQSPEEYWLLFRTVECYIQKNELSIAENMLNDYYKAMLRENKQVAFDYFILIAKVYFEQAKPDLVVEKMNKAVQIGDLNRNGAVLYLRALIAVNKLEEAYKYATNKYKNVLSPADFHFIRGLYYYNKNNINDAKNQLELSINAQTEIYEPYTLLKDIYTQNGDLQKAENILNKGHTFQKNRLINIGFES